MKLSKEEIQVREDIIKEAGKIALVYDEILSTIHKAPSEKKQLQGLKKLRQTMEILQRQNYLSLGKLN